MEGEAPFPPTRKTEKESDLWVRLGLSFALMLSFQFESHPNTGRLADGQGQGSGEKSGLACSFLYSQV